MHGPCFRARVISFNSKLFNAAPAVIALLQQTVRLGFVG
jgi:hypothetical protein